jgi:hypothetical protein
MIVLSGRVKPESLSIASTNITESLVSTQVSVLRSKKTPGKFRELYGENEKVND